MCATMIGSRGCRASSRCIDSGPVKSLPTGPEPACTRIGTSASVEQPPHVVEQRVVEVELPHLQVQLEQLDPVLDQLGDVRRDALLGEERGRPDHLRDVGREGARPVVEVRRHPGLVRVGQRREPAHPHRPQQLDPLLVRLPVADRPLAADLRARRSRRRARPPSGCSAAGSARARRRGRAARAPPRTRGPERRPRPVRRVSHPCPSAGGRRPARSPGWPAARRARAACPTSSCPWPARSRPWPGR